MKMGTFIVLKHSTARDENIKIYFKISHPFFFGVNHENTGFPVKF